MPKDYFISDVHIHRPNDEAANLFMEFLDRCVSEKANRVFLLGDIFDVLVGPYLEYEEKYRSIFKKLKLLLDDGLEIYYFEGNHDFHLGRFFENLKEEDPRRTAIRYVKGELHIKTAQGLDAHISHGDDMEIENVSYKIYKKVVNNRFVELLLEQILSFKFMEKLGRKASADSRKRNQKLYSKNVQENTTRKKFRRSAEILSELINVDVIIAGHSHCKDDYQLSNGTRYMNNGYALESQTYICSDEDGIRFVEI